MSGARLYGAGLLLIAVVATLVALRFTGDVRTAMLAMALAAMVIQGPLGWWMIRSVGTPQFLVAWVAGMLVRLGILGVAALVVLPLFHWPRTPGLLVLAGVLFTMLLLEGLVIWLEHSRVKAP